MRCKKFRAWHDKLDKMVYGPFSISHDGDVGWVDENGKDWSDFELLEYTGFKDNNGKEIYEGDIIKSSNFRMKRPGESALEWAVEMHGNEDSILVIGFDEKLGCFECKYTCGHWVDELFCDSLEDCEIIGNIYENPELLENNEE